MPKVADPQRAAETEAAILEASRDILAKDGLDALSMRAVGARVGLSATALYNYFENKQALVDRVVARGFRRLEDYLWRAVEEVPSGRIEHVWALCTAYLSFARENQQYFKIMFTIHPTDPKEIEELPGGGGKRILQKGVADAIASGEIVGADPDLLALYLWSNVHGLASLSLACDFSGECGCAEHEWTKDGITAERLFEMFAGFLSEGLRPRDGLERREVSQGTGQPGGNGLKGMDTAKGNGSHVEDR